MYKILAPTKLLLNHYFFKDFLNFFYTLDLLSESVCLEKLPMDRCQKPARTLRTLKTIKTSISTLPSSPPTVLAAADEGPLLPVNSSQQEYCITNDGDVLLAGDSWKANACTSCTCNNGTIQCFSQRCPAANCRVPVLRKGQCCPHCLGECADKWLHEGGACAPTSLFFKPSG